MDITCIYSEKAARNNYLYACCSICAVFCNGDKCKVVLWIWKFKKIGSDVVKAIDDDILNQVIAADRDGKDTMELYVPFYGRRGDWFTGERISNALYAHGIVNRKIEITVVPTDEMNKKYHLQ